MPRTTGMVLLKSGRRERGSNERCDMKETIQYSLRTVPPAAPHPNVDWDKKRFGGCCKREIQLWTEIYKKRLVGWVLQEGGRHGHRHHTGHPVLNLTSLAHTDQTLGEPKCTKKYQQTYILKAAVPGVQTPQTILNFPQKDWLKTWKLPSLHCLQGF